MRPDRTGDVTRLTDPPQNCTRCARLCAYRARIRSEEPEWFNAAVPSFGDVLARLLIVGLAPGRGGANRTGIPFFGDASGDMLLGTLARFGWMAPGFQTAGTARDAGKRSASCQIGAPPALVGAMITNAVRCVPPGNRPTASEIAACAPFLAATVTSLPRLRVILSLGRVAHDASLRAVGLTPRAFAFAHNASHDLGHHELGDVVLVDSYHCSRLNTNTGRLTQRMFDDVFTTIARQIENRQL